MYAKDFEKVFKSFENTLYKIDAARNTVILSKSTDLSVLDSFKQKSTKAKIIYII